MNPRILSVATAVPEHTLPQAEARDFARSFFGGSIRAIDRYLPVFANAGIAARQLARPRSWYEEPHDFPTKNAVYKRTALKLSDQAARDALRSSGVGPADIGAIVFVSTTGIATPSLDSFLVQTLELPRDVARVPIWGLGCAGGVAGLARAAELARARRQPVLLIAVEICTVTFMHGDRSMSNLIATALFGDGAAAVVVGPDGTGPEILASDSQLLDDSEDVMGWTLEPDGLRVRFAKSIPKIVHDVVPGFAGDCAREAGLRPDELVHFVLHPGGTKVLEAYEAALALDSARLRHARAVLREHGNMSSPTALFVLERFLRDVRPTGAPGIVVGLGPGFAAEGVVFRW